MKVSRIVSIGLLLFILLTIPLTKEIVERTNTSFKTKARFENKVEVFLHPDVDSVVVNQPFSVDVKINTGELVISGMKGEIMFDPNYVQLVRTDAGVFFTQPSILPDIQKVHITASERVVGNGTIVKLQFMPLQTGTVELAFADGGSVFDIDGLNALSEAPAPLRIQVN